MRTLVVNYRSVKLFFIALILIVIAGFRPLEFFNDSDNYLMMIHSYNNIYDAEPTLWIINQINQRLLGGQDQIFFLIYAILGISIKIIAIKRNSLYPWLSVYLYICFYFLLHEMTQIRVGVAGSIFLLAIPEIANKNSKNYFIKTFFAVLFHYSAIIMVLVYFLSNRSLNKKLYFLLPGFGILIALISDFTLKIFNLLSIILPSFLSDKIIAYLTLKESDVFTEINIFNFFTLSLIVIYYFLLLNFDRIASKLNIILIKLFAIQIFIFYAFSSVPVFSGRLSEFLGLNIILLIPNILPMFKQKAIPIVLIVLWASIYFKTIAVNNLIILN